MPNSVPKLWPGSTVVCIASGPSLTADDVAYVRGKARVIVINTTYQMAPWADVLYACDARWWKWHQGAPEFAGMKFALERRAAKWGVTVLKIGATEGLSDDPTTLCTGKNSGYQAINLAVHLGAARIVLLGYDMQRGPKGEMHWHPEHPMTTPHLYEQFRARYATLEQPLRERGIEVVNCSRRTALRTFPTMPLESVLPESAEVAA